MEVPSQSISYRSSRRTSWRWRDSCSAMWRYLDIFSALCRWRCTLCLALPCTQWLQRWVHSLELRRCRPPSNRRRTRRVASDRGKAARTNPFPSDFHKLRRWRELAAPNLSIGPRRISVDSPWSPYRAQDVSGPCLWTWCIWREPWGMHRGARSEQVLGRQQAHLQSRPDTPSWDKRFHSRRTSHWRFCTSVSVLAFQDRRLLRV